MVTECKHSYNEIQTELIKTVTFQVNWFALWTTWAVFSFSIYFIKTSSHILYWECKWKCYNKVTDGKKISEGKCLRIKVKQNYCRNWTTNGTLVFISSRINYTFHSRDNVPSQVAEKFLLQKKLTLSNNQMRMIY